MNKNKRFILVKCYNEQWGVVDRSLEGTDQLVLITTNKSGTLYLINELNALNNENKQLKADNNRLVNETARIVAEHQGRVLDLIDETIEYYSDKYELYDTNAIDVLEELKKELTEQ